MYMQSLSRGVCPAHPGAHNVGQGRAFYQRIKATEAESFEACKSAFALAKRGFKWRTPTASYLISVERAWAKIPMTACLLRDVQRTAKGLEILELRLSTGCLHQDDWSDDDYEAGLLLGVLRMTINKSVCQFKVRECAFISHHALSRFWQRSFKPSQLSIQQALAELFIQHKTALNADGTFSIKAGDGVWLGSICVWERNEKADGKIMRVATFK